MQTYLAKWIIKKYSKEGDTVLDPMSGISTSVIEASLLGRHGIGVEYEKKFVDLSNQSIKKSKRVSGMDLMFGIERGTMKVIHGDSRYLPQFLSGEYKMILTPVLKEGYTVMTMEKSLEVEKEIRAELKKTGVWPKEEDYECSWESKWMVLDTKNKKEVKLDTILTSPPYFSTIQLKGDSISNKSGAKIAKQKVGIIPPNSYSEDPNNIDNTRKYGEVDTIINSPPYSELNSRGGLEVHKDPEFRKKHANNMHEYGSKDNDNIANLKHGSVDNIITSPPYANQNQKD